MKKDLIYIAVFLVFVIFSYGAKNQENKDYLSFTSKERCDSINIGRFALKDTSYYINLDTLCNTEEHRLLVLQLYGSNGKIRITRVATGGGDFFCKGTIDSSGKIKNSYNNYPDTNQLGLAFYLFKNKNIINEYIDITFVDLD
jgi:hypothetical protein